MKSLKKKSVVADRRIGIVVLQLEVMFCVVLGFYAVSCFGQMLLQMFPRPDQLEDICAQGESMAGKGIKH